MQASYDYNAMAPRGSMYAGSQKYISRTISGRALLGGYYGSAVSSNAWAPGQGPHNSAWNIAPLSMYSHYGSQ